MEKPFGQEFNRAKDPSTAKPQRRIVAKGVPADDGSGWWAEFAYPGLALAMIGGYEKPFVYDTKEDAESAAFKTVVELWNDRLLEGSKNVQGTKMAPASFTELLSEIGLTAKEFAQLRGTTERRVVDWMAGVENIPFDLHWVLELLKDDTNLATAINLTERNLSFKPEWFEYLDRANELRSLLAVINDLMPGATLTADAWERDNPGKQNKYREAMHKYDEIAQGRSKLTLQQRIDRLKDLSGILGAGIDVNAMIEKQNEPYRVEVETKRRERSAIERSIKQKEAHKDRKAAEARRHREAPHYLKGGSA